MIDTRPDEVLVLQYKRQFMGGNYTTLKPPSIEVKAFDLWWGSSEAVNLFVSQTTILLHKRTSCHQTVKH